MQLFYGTVRVKKECGHIRASDPIRSQQYILAVGSKSDQLFIRGITVLEFVSTSQESGSTFK